jgi:hypothetical protein
MSQLLLAFSFGDYMLIFENLLLILVIVVGVYFIGIPSYRLYRTVVPPKKDPLKEAKLRLEQARLEAEAAKLNKETEQVYNNLYKDVLDDDSNEEEKHTRRL